MNIPRFAAYENLGGGSPLKHNFKVIVGNTLDYYVFFGVRDGSCRIAGIFMESSGDNPRFFGRNGLNIVFKSISAQFANVELRTAVITFPRNQIGYLLWF